MSRNPSSPHAAPEWFRPAPELAGLISEGFPMLSPWGTPRTEQLALHHKRLAQLYPERHLYPIAARGDRDDLACAERDRPGIVIIHPGAAAGKETVRSFVTVSEFRAHVEQEVVDHLNSELATLQKDPRYLKGIEWGAARAGHPEGSIKAHIAELEDNLSAIERFLRPHQIAAVRLLIHTHDTLKGEQLPGVAITDPKSHASLARAFVEDRLGQTALSPMIQFHDEFHALHKRVADGKPVDHERLNRLFEAICDWDTFTAFLIVDNATAGKDDQSLRWAVDQIKARPEVTLHFNPELLIKAVQERL